LKKAIKAFEAIETTVLSIPFLFLSVAIVVNIIQRKIFSVSFSWLEEFSRYFFVFSTFLGASIAITMDKHPKMSALQNIAGAKTVKWLILFSDILCVCISAYLCRYAVKQVLNLARHQTITSAMSLPLWIVYVIIPLSMAGMTIRFIILIVRDIKVVLGKAEAASIGAAAEAEAEIAELKGRK